MSFRTVVVSKSAKLDLKINHLVIREHEVTKVHIPEIAVLMIESTAISLTSALLCELIKQKVKIIFCDEKRNPLSELMPLYGSHDCSNKLSMQIVWHDDTKHNVWTEIIYQKISKQKEILEYFELPESSKLAQYLNEIEINDSTNREGHAAKVYFNALFGKSFTRDNECAINSALNYGYAILLSAFNREIVLAGYNTQIGIFHNNIFNPFNLTCDLMEAFRPLIDYYVKLLNPVKFDTEEKRHLVNILNMEIYINGTKQYLLNGIKIYVKSILDTLSRQDNAMIKGYKVEL